MGVGAKIRPRNKINMTKISRHIVLPDGLNKAVVFSLASDVSMPQAGLAVPVGRENLIHILLLVAYIVCHGTSMFFGGLQTTMVVVPCAHCVAGGIRPAQAACFLVVCLKKMSLQYV